MFLPDLILPHQASLCGSDFATVGAPYLGVAGGRFYFEVEVVKAEGGLFVGVGGACFSDTSFVGGDALSWGIYSGDGDGLHR